MAKRKYPKLPNKFGSIKKLSGNRSNPYAVYPPTTEYTEFGVPVTQKALCYVPDWYTGFYALMEYQNGTFDQSKFLSTELKETDKNSTIISKIISSYNNNVRYMEGNKTFEEVYQLYYSYKYEREKGKQYSKSSKASTRAAFNNCSKLHKKVFSRITSTELQDAVDDCDLKHASKELIVTLIKQMYKYAYANNLVDRDYSVDLRINTGDDDIKGVPFSKEEIDLLWENKDNPVIRSILVMIYSGFRITEYGIVDIDFENKIFIGGVKSDNSKNRIAPFCHLTEQFICRSLPLFENTYKQFFKMFTAELSELGIEGHTPHDCRHTFSWLCDTYKVDMLSKKLMLGHSLGSDVTDARYGHRTVEQLREEINKIKHW